MVNHEIHLHAAPLADVIELENCYLALIASLFILIAINRAINYIWLGDITSFILIYYTTSFYEKIFHIDDVIKMTYDVIGCNLKIIVTHLTYKWYAEFISSTHFFLCLTSLAVLL